MYRNTPAVIEEKKHGYIELTKQNKNGKVKIRRAPRELVSPQRAIAAAATDL